MHPEQVPSGWHRKDLPSGDATLAYPAGWSLTRTDPSTVTAALRGRDGIAGYLNITPKQGEESLDNWASFRPGHNVEEGDRALVPIASATGLPFRNGTGSCVKDEYTTETGHHYREIACIVSAAKATTVIVGATPPELWSRYSPTLERAISSFKA